MKILDLLSMILLVIGGLNWGLVGLLNFNLLGTLLGSETMLTQIAYTLVGTAALYQALFQKGIQQRQAEQLEAEAQALEA